MAQHEVEARAHPGFERNYKFHTALVRVARSAAIPANIKSTGGELTWSLKTGLLLERGVRFFHTHKRRGRRSQETGPGHGKRKSRRAGIVRKVRKQNPIMLKIEGFQFATQAFDGLAQCLSY
jgi:hypothetical protein